MSKANASDFPNIESVVLNALSSMLAYWSRDLRCVFANQAYQQCFGMGGHSLVGMTLDEVLGPELLAVDKPCIDAALEGSEQVSEHLVRHPDGTLRPSFTRYVPSLVDGDVVGLVAEVTDMSLSHKAQQVLRQQIADCARAVALLRKSELALEQAQQLGSIGSWEWEVETDITIWSKQLYRIFGRDPSRLPPTYAEHGELYTPASWKLLQQAVSQTLSTGESYVLELEYIRADGSTGWLEGRGMADRDPTGRIAMLHGTAQDISDRKRGDQATDTARQLAEALSELEAERKRNQDLETALARARKTEALGMLSVGIAHDFNNVLSVVSGALHLVKKTALDPRSQDFAERGLRGVDRATHHVRQLMHFARDHSPGCLQFDLASHLAGCQDLLAMSLGPGIQVHIDPQSCGVVDVDPSQLDIALINLLVNARDAMPHGGRVTIYTEPRDAITGLRSPAGGWAVIGVRDSGAGMSAELLARVREPFFTTKGDAGGTGLGLWMVNDFVRQANGHLEIDSRPGEGTVVAICLPRVLCSSMVDHDTPPDTAFQAPENGIVILVVDDDQMVLPIVSKCLHELGYVVLEASNAIKALEFARSSEPIRLVITDVRMHHFDGLQLAERLKAVRPSLPVLMMTGDPRPDLFDHGNTLVKPFTEIELARKVYMMLAARPVLSTRLASRIRHPSIMKLYESWVGLRRGDTLPSASALAPERCAARENIFVAEIVQASPFTARRIFVGQALADRLMNHPQGLLVAAGDDEAFAKMETAYRRCMRRREPSYEYARLQVGEGDVVEFERLLLPCEEQGGSRHHLVGIVFFSNLSNNGISEKNE